MSAPIRVVAADAHVGIVDGYAHRLQPVPDIELVGAAYTGEELLVLVATQSPDVLLLDVSLPTSATNPIPYSSLQSISTFLQHYPALSILVVSMYLERAIIQAVVEAGASGYILKDDRQTLESLPNVIRSVAAGGIHFSDRAFQQLRAQRSPTDEELLTPRQRQVLSLCIAYPNATTGELAGHLEITNSTVRNLLAGSYLRLRVRNRSAAILRALELGLISPFPTSLLESGLRGAPRAASSLNR